MKAEDISIVSALVTIVGIQYSYSLTNLHTARNVLLDASAQSVINNTATGTVAKLIDNVADEH